MSWRDRIAKLLTGKRPDITTVPPGPEALAWPPQLGPVDPAAPRAITRMDTGHLVEAPAFPRQPSQAQMNVNQPPADVLPFNDRWPQ